MKTPPLTPAQLATLSARIAARPSLAPMSAEEIKCLTDPAWDATDRAGYLLDLQDRCGVQTADLIFASRLSALGFALTHEGGGMYVYTLPLARGLRLVLADAQGDGEPCPAHPVSLLLMSDAHGDPLAQTDYASGIAAVDTLAQSLTPHAQLT